MATAISLIIQPQSTLYNLRSCKSEMKWQALRDVLHWEVVIQKDVRSKLEAVSTQNLTRRYYNQSQWFTAEA
jgi:hypothetical protein